ncbi:hypothetical protein DV515_00011910 [Chloebia gouldiae]|uniref:Uncharacterized protein n=1 Tax=Chloebia gouldiae TaxID=44316 RepID=A0A3L8S697_CHLGU|nr:hypothetical protein DV515_00011910 [Chloebia gouldiae]
MSENLSQTFSPPVLAILLPFSTLIQSQGFSGGLSSSSLPDKLGIQLIYLVDKLCRNRGGDTPFPGVVTYLQDFILQHGELIGVSRSEIVADFGKSPGHGRSLQERKTAGLVEAHLKMEPNQLLQLRYTVKRTALLPAGLRNPSAIPWRD